MKGVQLTIQIDHWGSLAAKASLVEARFNAPNVLISSTQTNRSGLYVRRPSLVIETSSSFKTNDDVNNNTTMIRIPPSTTRLSAQVYDTHHDDFSLDHFLA
jgi:hypothetical protein